MCLLWGGPRLRELRTVVVAQFLAAVKPFYIVSTIKHLKLLFKYFKGHGISFASLALRAVALEQRTPLELSYVVAVFRSLGSYR